jgi:hypothetical protein
MAGSGNPDIGNGTQMLASTTGCLASGLLLHESVFIGRLAGGDGAMALIYGTEVIGEITAVSMVE